MQALERLSRHPSAPHRILHLPTPQADSSPSTPESGEFSFLLGSSGDLDKDGGTTVLQVLPSCNNNGSLKETEVEQEPELLSAEHKNAGDSGSRTQLGMPHAGHPLVLSWV